MIIDTHCHLNDKKLEYFCQDIVETSNEDNMEAFLCVGCDIKSSMLAYKQASVYDKIYAIVGIHPYSANEYDENTEEQLIEMTKSNKVVAIGEIGLDYHDCDVSREKQKEVFIKQILLADRLKMPVVLHIRDAYEDALNIINEYEKHMQNGVVLHCFGGSKEYAEIMVKKGFYISFTGVITFKNAKKSLEVVKSVPLDKILVETDSPYLAPEPFRGKINEPKNVNKVVEKMSEILQMPINELENIFNNNAKTVFKRLV